MANTFTPPVYVKSKPHASAEKQVGDSDPSARTDVINRVVTDPDTLDNLRAELSRLSLEE